MPQQLTRSQLNLLQQRRDELPPEWQATVDKLSRVNNAPTVDRSAAYETFNSAILTKDVGRRNAVMTDTLREATGLLDADTKRLAAHLGYKDEEELASAFGNWIEPYSRTDPATGEERASFINEAGKSPSRLDMLKIDLAGQLPGGMTAPQRSAELKEKRKDKAAQEFSLKHFVQTTDILRRQLSPETSRALDALSLAKEVQTRVDGFMAIAPDLEPDEFAAAYQYLTLHIPEIDQKKWRSSFIRGVVSMGQNLKTSIQLEGQSEAPLFTAGGLFRELELNSDEYFDENGYKSPEAKAALRAKIEQSAKEFSLKVKRGGRPFFAMTKGFVENRHELAMAEGGEGEGFRDFSKRRYALATDQAALTAKVDAAVENAPALFREGARLNQEFMDRKKYYDDFRARVEKSGNFLGDTFNEFLEMAPHTLAVGALGASGNTPAALLLSYSQIQPDMEMHYRRAGMSANGAHLTSKMLAPLAVSLDYVGARAATRGTAGAVQKAFANGLKNEIVPLIGIVIRAKGLDYVEEVLTEGGQKLVEDIALVYADRYAHIEGLTTGQLFDDVLDETMAAMRSMWWVTAGPAARDAAGGALYQGLKKATPTKWYLDLQSEVQQRRNEAAEQAANSEPFFVPDTEGETWAVPPRTAVRYTLAKTEDEKYSIVKEVMESNLGMTEQQAKEVLANIEENGADFASQYEARVNSILADMGVRGSDQGTPVGRERSKGVTTAIEEVLSRLEKRFASGKNVTVRTHSTVELALADPDIDEQTKQRLRNGEGVQAFENNGTVVFISENMDSRGEAISKFAHEVLGHGSITDISSDKSIDAFLQVLDRLGIREDRIKAMYDFLVGLSSAYKGQLAKKVNGVYVDENGNEVAGPEDAAIDERAVADELIARISEKMMNEETLDIEEKRIAEKLRDWLGRNLGFQTPLEWANQEVGTIVRNLMRGDVDGARQQGPGPRFSTNSPEFKNWFKDSKVVDEQGRPLVVYHGSENAGFTEFDTRGRGKTEGTGAFFSNSNMGALTYSGTQEEFVPATIEEVAKDPESYGIDIEENEDGTFTAISERGYTYDGDTVLEALQNMGEDLFDARPGNYEVYLSIQNPLVIDANGANWDSIGQEEVWRVDDENGDTVDWFYDEESAQKMVDANEGYTLENYVDDFSGQSTDALAREARDGGYDGLIIENVIDEGTHGRGYGWGDKIFAVFNPEQIKSVYNNTFDPRSPDIRYSSRDLSGDIGTGRGYTDFFGNFHEAKGDEWFFPHGEYQPAINLDTDADAFQRTRGKYMGNFDLHIATSIPGFSDLQAIVGDALVKAYGEQGARVLDIGASEGALVKAMAELTGGRISSIALDPNPKMKATFDEKGRVDGVEYRLEALGDNDVRGKYAWSEIDKNTGIATQINFFDPGNEKFDVIHEAMVFQFLSNQRASQLDIVKSMMAEDGVVILEEKFAQADIDQYNANEDKKDYDWKSKYYTEEQIERKRKEVLEKGGDTIEGMAKMQVTVEEMHELLADRFNHFVQFWDSGNFMGFIASDSDVALKNVLDNMQDTSSEYSNNPVGEIQSASRYSVEETRKAQAVHELQVLQVPLRTDGRLQLTHWSPVAGIASLEPESFGTGPVVGRERGRAGQGFVNRVQFGLAGYRREVDPGHRYTASVEPGELYPLLRDPLGLQQQARMVVGEKGNGEKIYGGTDINRYEQLIQENGYQGFISQSQFGPVAALFESVPVESVVDNDTSLYAPVEVDAQGQDALRSWNYLQNLGYIGGLVFRRAGSPAGMDNNNLPRYSVTPRKVDALGFYSPIRTEVEAMDFKQIPPRQLADRIRKLPKQEEMEDLGLYDWLELQDGKVTKEAVLAFIDQGGVQLNQIVKGGEEEILYDVIDQDGNEWLTSVSRDEAENAVENQDDEAFEGREGNLSIRPVQLTDDSTEHAQHIMEGPSSNYREFSLTLPVGLAPNSAALIQEKQRQLDDLETVHGFRVLDGEGYVVTEDPVTEAEAQRMVEANFTQGFSMESVGPIESPDAQILRNQISALSAGKPEAFTHGHWPGIQNPLVHFRTTDRQVDGKPTLFLEEIQSDWIQRGRKKGFKKEPVKRNLKVVEENNTYAVYNEDGSFLTRETKVRADGTDRTIEDVLYLVNDRLNRAASAESVPDPGAFKRSGTVDMLAFKRALAIAVFEGYDNIAWTPAVEQIRRWSDSLQQQVRSISWEPGSGTKEVLDAQIEQERANINSWMETLKETSQARELAFKMDDAQGVTANNVTIERLQDAIMRSTKNIEDLRKRRAQPAVTVEMINTYDPELILYYDEQGVITGYENAGGRGDQLLGKNLSEVFDNSIAKQILSEPEGKLEGDGLTIGGKGFKDFYDGLLPREVQKYVKKMGGRVGVGKAAIVNNPVTHIHTNIDGEYEVIDLGSSRVLVTKPSYAEAENWVSENIGPSYAQNEEVWNVEITDQMRDEVSQGQPRYSIRNGGEQGSVLEDVQIDETKWRQASDTRYAFASIEGVDDPPFIDLSDLNGLEKFVFASDRTKVGPYTPIHPESRINIMLQGGPGYPFAADNQGKAAWAVSAGSQPAKGFDKRVGQVGLITLYNRDNAVKNPSFASVYMAEVQEAIDRGELSKTRFLRVANQLRVAAKRMKNGNGKSIVTGKWAELWRLNWTSLEEMEFALRAAPFDVRSKAFFSPVGKVGGRGFNKIGRNDLVKAGFPDMNLILDGFVDRNLDHMPHGTIVGAVEVGGVSAPHTEHGVPAHDSYSAVIPGRGIGLLRQPVALSEVVDDEAGRQGWLHTRTHTGRMSPANDVQYSIREQRDPLTEATVDMATRILEGKNLNRRQAEMIINRYYRGVDVNKAIYRAHKLAAELKNEWPELEDSWERAVARVRAAEQVLGYAERAQEAYDSISTEFKAKYLQGRLDKTLADNAARRGEQALAREKSMKASDLAEQKLLIDDPVEQLDVKEELKQVIERKKQEDEDAGIEPEQNPEVSDAEIEEVTVAPKPIQQYLSDLKKAVAKHSGLEQGSAEFLVAYRQTLVNALDSSIRSLTYGRTRESLLRHLGQLNDLKTEQGLDRRAASILWNAFQQGARDGRKEAVSKFQKVFRRRLKNKTRNKTGSWTRDTLDKTKARMFKFMLDVSRLKPDEVREMQEDLQTELDNGLEKFYALEKDKRGLVADEIADLQMKLELLDRYGALSYKSLAQINDAVDTALNDLDAAFEEQKKRIDERKDVMQARKDLIISALMSAKGKVKRTELAERIEATLSIYPMSLHSLLQDMIRFASPKLHSKLWNDDVRAEGQVWSLKQLSKDILTRQARIRERKRRVHQDLLAAVQEIYGISGKLKAQAKLAQLMKANENFRKYSKHKNPKALSLADLMQMVAYLEQDFYSDNAERHGRMQDYETIRNELSDQDYALIEWMREFYRGTRQELSDKKRELTGLGFPVEIDENYMPVSIQQYGSFRGVNTSLQLTPGIYADRRHHTKDIVEGQDIFTLFFDRNHKNAVYLELAELSLDIAEIFGDAELQQTMTEVYGERYTKHILRMLFDTMSQKPLRYGTDGATNALLNYGAIVMTFNLASAARQPASAWEFGLDLKDLNLSDKELKGLKERAGKQQLLPFIVEIFRSEHAAARFDAGQSYEIAAAFESEGMSALKTWVGKWGMAPNKMMDLVTIATFGARTYRLYYQHMLDVGMDEAEARKAALEWTWAEAETHQQSGFISNQAPWQRSGDALQKLAGMFSSTPQQFLSIQNQLYRQAKATGNWKPFIRSAIIHHVLGPATYKAIDTLFQLALGRPPDEDEWKEWLAFMVLGPYSGGFVYRMILAYGIDKIIGNKSGVFGIDLIPAERGIEVMGDFIDMLKALLIEGDVDKALGEGDRILDTFQPYNYASAIKENYFDQ